MFHWKDGLFFGRKADGSVRVILARSPRMDSSPNPESPEGAYGGPLDATIPASEWASIVSSVSKRSETYETHEQALAFHEKEES